MADRALPAGMRRWLKADQVAARYGVDRTTIYRWVRQRRLAVLRLPGGDLRFSPDRLPEEPPPLPPKPPKPPKPSWARQLIAQAQARAAESPDSPPGFVYFVREVGERGPIKIGTAVNPLARLKGLQVAHHRKLVLLATLPGNARSEAEIHRAFRSQRIGGEWFKASRRLLAFIAEATADG